jgi:hypothetical protein
MLSNYTKKNRNLRKLRKIFNFTFTFYFSFKFRKFYILITFTVYNKTGYF